MAQARQPLKDVAAVNSVRWALWRLLSALGLPLETGTGGRTKFNRTRLLWEKAHWRDAACVGASTSEILGSAVENVLLIAAKGHGSRQICGTNASGFPIRHKQRQKWFFGVQTGDLVRAVVPKGARKGTHTGRVTQRVPGASGWIVRHHDKAGAASRNWLSLLPYHAACRWVRLGLKPLKRGRSSQG
jgi:hypothetical protein